MQLPGLTVGIVADDLTGANDTALQFYQHGCQTRVLLDLTPPPKTESAQVWAINTETRHSDPREAVAATRRAVALLRDQYGVENFYKKMDSTLRGHVAQECLAVLDELKWECAVVVPAYPQEGRRTVGGYQLVRGTPVEKTEVARDPLYPVRQSHVPTLLQQSTRPEIVGHVQLSTVMHGAGPILMALSEQIKAGKKLVVVDACSMVDLEQVALAIEKIRLSARVLPCGSAGLALALTKLWSPEPDSIPEPRPLQLPVSPVLIVSGTNSQTTRNQLYQLKENYPYYGDGSKLDIVDVAPEKILGRLPVDAEVQQILHSLDQRNTVVVSISLSEENFPRTLEVAEALGIPAEEVPLKGQEVLAGITRRVMEQAAPKLVLSGGETATHITRVLGSRSLEIRGMAEPSIPLLRDDQHRWIITKSGNFGSPLAMANIVHTLKQAESASLPHG